MIQIARQALALAIIPLYLIELALNLLDLKASFAFFDDTLVKLRTLAHSMGFP